MCNIASTAADESLSLTSLLSQEEPVSPGGDRIPQRKLGRAAHARNFAGGSTLSEKAELLGSSSGASNTGEPDEQESHGSQSDCWLQDATSK
jgi:hypothetical protein